MVDTGSFHATAALTPRKELPLHIEHDVAWPQKGSEIYEEEITPWSCWELNHDSSISHYTNWATPAPPGIWNDQAQSDC